MSAQEERAQLTRPEDARDSNDRIAERAAQFRFVSRVPMLCECNEPGCQTIFLIELGRYQELRERGYLTAPEHPVDHAAPIVQEDGYWLHQPVRR
jgi:hypothetical protein